jgi:hypothetical protein
LSDGVRVFVGTFWKQSLAGSPKFYNLLTASEVGLDVSSFVARRHRARHEVLVTGKEFPCDARFRNSRWGEQMSRPGSRKLDLFALTVRPIFLLLVLAVLLRLAISTYAGVGGSISGTVKDSSGGAVPKAMVSATNRDTAVRQEVRTNDAGAYFLSLPVGHYDVDIIVDGFRPYRRTDIAVDVNSTLLVDAVLEVGAKQETVTVQELAVQAETSSTQLGEVIAGKSVAALPLNGRSYTDLLALQPGVVPETTITSLTVQGLGQSVFSPSGDLNPGTLSIDGQRESANGFMVNGADAEEMGSMAAAIIPNLDSIVEFRILSDTDDAQYGRYTGGQINVITKSGANELHGNVFEFLRNTDLDARNYFSPTRGTFIQNQFGGTLGGPIVRKKVFFYSDYQGTRQIQGTDSGLISVPSLQDRTGDLSDQAGSLTGKVSGPYFAALLSQKLDYAVSTGEPYYTPGCVTSSQCVLPNATIPIERVVQSGYEPLEVHPRTESFGQRLFHIGV